MSFKTILWSGFFAVTCIGALYSPILGIIGYMGHYIIGPERQWWEQPLHSLGLRYSFSLAAFTAVGIALNYQRLRFGKVLFTRHEKLVLLFLAMVWLLTLVSPATVGKYTRANVDHPSMKYTKVVIFTLMVTHVATTRRNMDRMIWAIIFGSMILGFQAYATPHRQFFGGRLNTVGGADFAESNVLPAFLAGVLPLIGVQFLGGKWIAKATCVVTGVFALNAMVLARSRGAMVGLALGCFVGLLRAPAKLRTKLIVCMFIAGAGGLYLADPQFLERIATVGAKKEERDVSSQQRLDTWIASMRMLKDHPFGVGVGNFYQTIGRYDARYAYRDAHNTYVRCACELGLPGIFLLFGIIVSAVLTLRQSERLAAQLPTADREWVRMMSFGLTTGLTAILGCAITISLTYVEMLWWFLMFPVCLQRTTSNLLADQEMEYLAMDSDDTEYEPQRTIVQTIKA